MAYGDIFGDLSQAYMGNAERAAKNGVQSITGGPIARAAAASPALAASGVAAVPQPGMPQINPTPTNLGNIYAPSSAPVGVMPVAGSPSYPTNSQAAATLADGLKQSSAVSPIGLQQPVNVATSGANSLANTAAPALQQPPAQQQQSLNDAYRPVGIGSGSSAIVARVGANGVPEFSNMPSAQSSAAGATAIGSGPAVPNSLQSLSPGGASANPNAPLSSLGSVNNLGDGVGTFSQANAGDADLAMTRFARAASLRDGYRAQDQLEAAQANQIRDKNFSVVRDSSQPVTRREIQFDQGRANTTQGLADAANMARGDLGAQRQNAQLDQQQRQAQRVEDAFVAASSPNATQEQKQRYQSIIDPTGANSVDRQLKQAQLNNAQLEGLSKQQGIAKNTVTQQQAVEDRAKSEAGQAATFDQAIGSIDSLLGTNIDPKNPNGARLDEDPGLTKSLGKIDALLPTLPGGDAADFQARLDTLKAQTFLPQVAALRGTGALSDAEGKKLSDSVGALSTKMSEDAFRKSLAEVRSTLQAAKDRSSKGSASVQQPAAQSQSGAPQPGTVQQGYIFLGGDPASQSSWRKQ